MYTPSAVDDEAEAGRTDKKAIARIIFGEGYHQRGRIKEVRAKYER
jgi:hypothetical protein